MRDKSDRFGAVELSPRRDAPLLEPGSALLDAIGSPNVSLTLRVVSAQALRPMQKGITSNPMCEISLLLDDGHSHRHQRAHSSTDQKLLVHHGNSAASVGGISAKTFKSNVVRSTLNPIWNLDVDFGDYNMENILGVLLVVKHVEKMGMVKRDIGQVLIPTRELIELRSESSPERTYTLEATDEINAREAQEGPSNRKYGKVTVRFNCYGLAQSTQQVQNFTSLMSGSQETRSTALSDGSVTHEDDFSGEGKRSGSHDVQAEVKTLQSFHQTKPMPGETWYAISSQWITSWLLYVSKHRGKQEHHPGTIDNMCLLSDELPDGRFEIRRDLVIKKDFRMINKRSWDYYQEQYDGGPAIEVPVPTDCVNTATWLSSLKLWEAARVGSSYLD